jgi:hypothetical protein
MLAADTHCIWDFTADPIDTSDIQCPGCQEWSPLAEWREGEAACDQCGSHAAMVCPKCNEHFDHVHGPTFQVRDGLTKTPPPG